MSDNIKVRARAKAACDYAKSLNPNFSYWYQTKTTQARSYNGKVMIVSKG
jgi:phosphodiesterase/alkaline phosphatase D-like protein